MSVSSHLYTTCTRPAQAACDTVHVPMEILIRDARPGDAPGVASLLTQVGYLSSSDEAGERLAEWRESPLSRVIVAADGRRVAGVLGIHAIPFLEHAGWRGRVVCLVVDEAYRSLGVGARLMAAAEAEARRLGCTDIEVTSSRARTEAHAFYQRMGYRDCCDRSALAPVRPGSAAGGLGSDLQVEVPGGQALLLGEAECVPVNAGGCYRPRYLNIQWLNYLRTFRRGFTTIAPYYEPSVLRWSRG